jgi:folate receptor
MVSDTSRKFRNQRYYKIPLCKRDCESWFDACKYDYTCRDNWKKGFKWQDGMI